jgi:predicted nucleic acid-binding protein
MEKMKALLDTNIVIHREASQIINQSIGILFRWLDKAGFIKCIHSVTVAELNKNRNETTRNTFFAKTQSYEILNMIAPLSPEVATAAFDLDVSENDKNDTILINELYNNRVDILISEDKKIHEKAIRLGIEDKVFTIDSFLELVVAEHPDLINYKVLAVKQEYFGKINLKDQFFDSLREDYHGFDNWFNKKSEEKAYVTYNNDKLLSFLYLKTEGTDENYFDIFPVFKPKKRLKIGTFKIVSNGLRLGERFMKIIFDNALINNIDEIYVTIFDKREDQQRLIDLLKDWGFIRFGTKGQNDELVYIRDFSRRFDINNPKRTFPFITSQTNAFLVPIYPEYHTNLLPDSYLRTESPDDFIENEPHKNALSKVYISRSYEKNIRKGDIIVFYRTGGFYKSVITTLGLVEDVIFNIKTENDFIRICRKRSVFADAELKKHWHYYPNIKPFVVKFLYIYSFPHRINLQRLIELNIITDINSVPRGFFKITRDKFLTILKETQTNDHIIIY